MTETIDIPLTPRIPSMVGKDRVSFFLNGRFRSYHLKSQQGQQLLELLKAEVQDLERIGELSDIITWIAAQTNGRVTVEESTDRLRLDGKLIDFGLSGRIATIVEQGVPFEHLARFIELVSENPDKSVAEDLYRFIEKGGLPLTPDGHIMAFKGVDANGWSHYTGVNGKVHYEVGKTASMPREDCDPNRQRTCSRGLHACSFGYLNSWYRNSGLLLAVKINPSKVTAIPADHNDQKLRCCEMEVMAIIPHEDAETHYPKVIDTRYPPKPDYPTWELSDEGRLAGGPPMSEAGQPLGWIEVGNTEGTETAWVWAALPAQTGEGVEEGAEPTAPADAVNDGPLKFTAIDGGEDASAHQIGFDEGYVNGRKDKANDYPADNEPGDGTPWNDPHDAQDYASGYAEGYDKGYAEDADPAFEEERETWTTEDSRKSGTSAGIIDADQDHAASTYDNDPAQSPAWREVVDWVEENIGVEGAEVNELVQVFERSYRDAYHTRHNSKSDEQG